MESDEHPTVREHLAALRSIEAAVLSLLRRISAINPIDLTDASLITIQNATERMLRANRDRDLLAAFLLVLAAIDDGNMARAKARLAEALHVLVNDPVRLLDQPGESRSTAKPPIYPSRDLHKP